MAEHMPTEDRLRELLVGKSIVTAEVLDESPGEDSYATGPTGVLTLSDGTALKVWGNDGGCACSAGCYPLSHLAACENVITNVQVEERPDGDDVPCRTCGKDYCYEHGEGDGYYRVFVFAIDERINVASFDGSDGNGYYGTGWWLSVQDG
jgi:hypothetical protein